MDQSKCSCSDKSFPEKWAKPTCGGTSHGGGNISFQLVVKIIVAEKKMIFAINDLIEVKE